MANPTVDLNGFIQVGLVVNDLEATVKAWSEIFGIPVPQISIISPPEDCQIYYRGEKSNSRAKMACIQVGNVVFELMQADDCGSSWKEFHDQNGGRNGVHHLGFTVGSDEKRDSVISMLEDRGIGVRHYGYYPGGSYTFVDSEEQLGVNLNIKPGA